MDIRRIIRSLSHKQLLGVAGIAIVNPVLFYCFLKATQKCVEICNKEFGKTHHMNNTSNAYRHALWNMLIIFYSLKSGKKLTHVNAWAALMTNKHEDLFKNNALEKIMDLHNNKMGRIWFKEMYQENNSLSITDLKQRLIKECKSSQKITQMDIQQLPKNALVFIYEKQKK